mgnify:FL=1
MRGKPLKGANSSKTYGITPADAGKTRDNQHPPTARQDHPRGCGENRKLDSECQDCRGSPPRMRGKHCIFEFGLGANRITPADAGKTIRFAKTTWHNRDHPRGCGENTEVKHNVTSSPGSPPRMRGKQGCNHRINHYRRITPADAGKTNRNANEAETVQDHPRGCGENRLCSLDFGHCIGSPPRMRGKL